ncbi:MAG: Smr/MutS family protein, partial [Saprospiraceae bacterium]
DTAFDFLIDIGMYIGDEKLFHAEDFSHACSAIELGELLADDLNDHPEVDALVQRMTTAGTDTALKNLLKIKPKSFFNRLLHVPILQMPVHHFVLFDRFDTPDADEAPKDDLKAYTKQKLGNATSQPASNSRPFRLFNVEEFATFVPEIDLHIENLTEGWQRMSSADILRIQLQHCQRFLDKAIRLGVPSVFIIHGVGEGKLRDAIGDALRHNPQVKKFKNQYHQKFGYGATEVWF